MEGDNSIPFTTLNGNFVDIDFIKGRERGDNPHGRLLRFMKTEKDRSELKELARYCYVESGNALGEMQVHVEVTLKEIADSDTRQSDAMSVESQMKSKGIRRVIEPKVDEDGYNLKLNFETLVCARSRLVYKKNFYEPGEETYISDETLIYRMENSERSFYKELRDVTQDDGQLDEGNHGDSPHSL